MKPNAAVDGVISDGLMIAVLPAAKQETNGPTHKLNGKFQGARIRQTPFGSYRISERVPR